MASQTNETLRGLGVPWETLQPGTPVRLITRGEFIGDEETVDLATVDVAMPDGSVVWVWLSSGRGRMMVHQRDGIRIHVEPPRA